MIKKTIFFSTIFLVAYCIFIAWIAPNWWNATQNTEQENIVKAQSFIYDQKTPSDYVIVGSSLTERIVQDSLPGVFNLAFGGLSIYDGLSLVTHKKALPKVVLIEMNLVFRRENKNFTSSLFSPLTYYPKMKIKALRDEKEPIAVCGKIIMNSIYATKDYIRKIKFGKKKDVINAKPKIINGSKMLSNKMIREAYISFFHLPKNEEVIYNFTELKKYTDQLKKESVKLIFFEMPIDKHLENLPLTVFIRKQFYATFPKSEYQYIPLPDWDYIDTFDGQHLSQQEAIRYTKYLRDQLN
jgi:hypothetical protein